MPLLQQELLLDSAPRSSRPLRLIARAVLVVFLNAVIWPSWAVAVEIDQQQQLEEQQRWLQDNQQLDQVLANLRDHISQQRQQVLNKQNAEQGFVSRALSFVGFGEDALPDNPSQRFQQRLNELRQDTENSLAQEAARLQEHGLPAVVLERQQQLQAQILARYQQLQEQLTAATQEQSLDDQEQQLNALNDLLNSFSIGNPRDPFDPEQLPWGTPDPKLTPEPAQDAKLLSQRYDLPLFEQGVQLASNVITPDMLGNPGGPVQADLDATLDAPLSPAIIAKAGELNNDPVAIYQWVRNNVEYIPSYGSVQGAEYTLTYQKGNAFDTASLLVALLRAANVPARYAFGTVRMPAASVMNWVGNVQVPEAAGNLLGQGGVPSKMLVSGGQVTHFELEHVWVEAWIDYLPSRGAKHSVGDSWIPMDASYKQYEYQDGMGLDQAVPFDAQALADSLEQSSTVNEDEGWVQGIPQQDVEQALTNYQAQLEDYINSQAPDATVGDVLGTAAIKTVVRESLAASLPYELRTRKLVASALTDNQRWKFKYTLGSSQYGQMGNILLSINQPTALLAGKKLALSFAPASEADEQTLTSYLPEPDANGDIDPAAVPDTLPGYLIHLNGEFTIGSEIAAATSSSVTMGTELLSEMGYWQPGRGWRTSQNKPIAGEYRALALDLHGVSPAQADALKNDLENTQQKITAEDYTELGKQQLVGDLLYATILSYFALNNVQDDIAARQANMVSYKAPSYGLFKTNVAPLYWFGIPRNVKMDGLVMDVDHITHLLAHKNNDTQQWINYNRASGARLSAMEHLVPEQMFSTEDSPANGISAVKALQLAAAEGQKIWTITRTNLDIALNGLQLPASIETDIRNSVYAGKEVTAHEKPVRFFGKSSIGYTVLDPETGAGAYLIGGGENGGDILTAVSGILGWLSGITSAGDNGKPIFDGGYKSLYKAAQAAKFLGIAALLAEAFLTLTDSSLSWSNKLGRLSGAMFAFASTTLVIGAAFAFAGPVFAAIIGVVFAIFMSVLLSAFYSRYLSQNTSRFHSYTRLIA